MKHPISLLSALAAAAAFAMPEAENVTFTQDNVNIATITYTLTESPAIVTLDIETNVTGDVWASIGAGNIAPGVASGSAAYRKVTGAGPHTITWRPSRSWPSESDAGNVPGSRIRAVVKAWALDNPPDYMVVDISGSARPNTWRYYPDADSVPGGVLGNEAYRKTALLMRKILARDVTWTMGSIGEDGRNVTYETSRMVSLTNDYYMAVFETTQEQWRQVMGEWPVARSKSNQESYNFTNALYRAMRPAQNISYNEIRTSGSYNAYNVGNDFPNAPHENSFLGKLRARTGVDFDLPSEAQWEFACRAGNGEGFWGDGAVYMSTTMPGRYLKNGAVEPDGSNLQSFDYDCGPESGTAICGSYAPNSWGLYDMHGNLAEYCIDWFQASWPAGIGASPNVNLSNPAQCLDGTTGTVKTKRGGCWTYQVWNCRSASRNNDRTSSQYLNLGCRVICPFEK